MLNFLTQTVPILVGKTHNTADYNNMAMASYTCG